MRLLLDSQAVLLTMSARSVLPAAVLNAISDARNERYISAATPYELEWKRTIGKLRFVQIADWSAALRSAGYLELPIGIQHSAFAARLPPHHRDPWDRILVAQALLENLVLVTGDSKMAAYGVTTLW